MRMFYKVAQEINPGKLKSHMACSKEVCRNEILVIEFRRYLASVVCGQANLQAYCPVVK